MRVQTDLWNQFGGNPAGSGFRLVNSIRASELEWIVGLPGPTGTSSAVFGPGGTIYIGTTNGHLLAIQPEPPHHVTVKWDIQLPGFNVAVQTPAVADDGTIYCLCSAPGGTVRDHRTIRGSNSFVIAVDPKGTIRWQVPIRTLPDLHGDVNCIINSAPRVISGVRGIARVIFVARYTLVVQYPELGPGAEGPLFVCVLVIVDERGRFLLFNRYESKKLFVEAEGGGGFGSATLGEVPSDLPASASPCSDTPVVFGSFPARDPWTIVAPGDDGLYEIKWSEEQGALTQAPKLFPLPYPGGPAAFPNGLITGASGSSAKFIDAETFTPYLPNETFLGDPSTVAGGLRQMYFLVRYGALIAVDSNGKVWTQRWLNHGSVALPALSANHVHVATTGGLHTLSLDLQEIAFVNLAGMSAGFSSPAIGPDGNIYVAAGSFPPEPSSNATLFSFFDESPRMRGGQNSRQGQAPPARSTAKRLAKAKNRKKLKK